MAQAQINPKLLSWARERAALSVAVLANKLSIDVTKLEEWESGTKAPTFNQAQNFAKKTFIPFGYLFLKKPPEEKLLLPDLRTVGSQPNRGFSLDLKDAIRYALVRQEWYIDYLRAQGVGPLSFVGRSAQWTDPIAIAKDIKNELDLPDYPQRGSSDDYFRDLILLIEQAGVLVMRNSMVGSNTHRLLSVDEFRGFAIINKLAPTIFINTADSRGARLFTLIHELAHIWLGESGVSDACPDNHSSQEQVCNAVAAEFLTPEDEFRSYWKNLDDWQSNIAELEAHFHVSKWVVARRALTLGYIKSDVYQKYIRNLLDSFKKNKGSGAPTYNTLQKARISITFARAVASEAMSGRVLLRDAAKLIGVKPHKIIEFSRKELKL